MQSHRRSVATLYGIGGLYNYGCEAIVRGTVFILRNLLPEIDIRYLTPRAEDDSMRIGDLGIRVEQLYAGRRGIPIRLLNKLATTLCLPFDSTKEDYARILNGTDLLVSIGGDIYTIPAYKRKKARYPYFNQLVRAGQLAKKGGIPEVVIGASVGPFGGYAPAVNYYAEHLKQIDFICCRERRSVDYLASIGICDNVCLMPDPAFFVEGDDRDDVWGAAEYLGVNLSPLSLREINGYEADGDATRFARLVSLLMDQTGLPAMFVPHVFSSNQHDNDLLFLEKVAAAMDDVHRRRVEVVTPEGFLDAKRYLRRCRVVIAARMHCAVNAICEGVPTILLSYSQKAVGMCEYGYGSNRWVLPLQEATTELPAKLGELFADSQRIHEELLYRVAAMRLDALDLNSFSRFRDVIVRSCE